MWQLACSRPSSSNQLWNSYIISSSKRFLSHTHCLILCVFYLCLVSLSFALFFLMCLFFILTVCDLQFNVWGEMLVLPSFLFLRLLTVKKRKLQGSRGFTDTFWLQRLCFPSLFSPFLLFYCDRPPRQTTVYNTISVHLSLRQSWVRRQSLYNLR